MSNTDFEDTPNGQTAGEELVFDPTEDAANGQNQDDAEDAGHAGEGPDDEGGQEEVAPRRNRANETIRELRARAQENEERIRTFERELMEIKAREQARQQAEDPNREAERLELMTPDERADYKLNNALNTIRREQALTTFRVQDEADKARFDAKATADKVYAKYAERVEQARLKYMREQNTVIPREELLKHMVGDDVLRNRGRNTAKQTAQGRQNIQRQQAPLANGKGNAQGNRRGAQDTPAKRLEGVQI